MTDTITEWTSPRPTINLELARELLASAEATQGPEFRYNATGKKTACFNAPLADDALTAAYFSDFGMPAKDDPRRITGCLIGTALTLHGETRHAVSPWLNSPISSFAIHHRDEQVMTPAASRYFAAAQNVQDRGGTWGEARAAAEALVKVLTAAELAGVPQWFDEQATTEGPA